MSLSQALNQFAQNLGRYPRRRFVRWAVSDVLLKVPIALKVKGPVS